MLKSPKALEVAEDVEVEGIVEEGIVVEVEVVMIEIAVRAVEGIVTVVLPAKRGKEILPRVVQVIQVKEGINVKATSFS